MGIELTYEPGQTPLDEDEKEGLIPPVDTREELNELEQANIVNAIEWSRRVSYNLDEILSEEFLYRVHTKMFEDVWKWAGTRRKSNKNLGVDRSEISTALRNSLDDCRYWIGNKIFDSDEIAIRFKHRIVSIHPFPNGNGRHSRLIADILISKHFRKPVFSWGGQDLVSDGKNRRTYLEALRKADSGEFGQLMAFARS